MKKATALVVAAFTLVSLLSGCGQQNNSTVTKSSTQAATATEETKAEETKTAEKLTGNIVFATNRTDKADSTLKDMAKEFMETNPGVTIEIEGIQQPEQVLKTRMAAGELPDITLILNQILQKDYPLYFAPLDDLGLTKDNMNFYENGLGADGKLYGLSSDLDFDGITYNKNTFSQAGISAVPRTLPEFYAACEKLKAKGIIPLATVYKDAWPLAQYTDAGYFAAANTGNAGYKNALKDKDDILSDDGGILTAFKLLREMNEKGYLDPDLMSASWDSTKRDQAQGKISMIYLGAWYPQQLMDNGAKKEDIGMFPFPGTKAIGASGGWMYGISKNSKSIDAAKAFVKWMWEDGHYFKATGAVSPLKSTKIENSITNELLSYNLPLVPRGPVDPTTTDIFNKSALDLNSVLQEYMISKNPEDVVKKTNEKWAKARHEVLGN